MTTPDLPSDPNNGAGGDAGRDGDGGREQTFTQRDLERIIGERLAREREKYSDYEDLKAKAARLDELEEANKSEHQKLLERVEAAERRAEEAERARAQAAVEMLRTKVAVDKGLPPALAARLRGETEEEIAADADELLASVSVTSAAPTAPSFDQGPRGTGSAKAAPTVASGAELYAQRNKKT